MNVTDTNIFRPTTWLRGVTGLVEAIFVTVITVGNMGAVLAFIKNKKLRTFTNVFLIQLSIADLLCGVTLTLHLLEYNIKVAEFQSEELCVSICIGVYICLTASTGFLLVLTTERYLVITRPFSYINRNKWPYVSAIVCVWMCGFIHGAIVYVYSTGSQHYTEDGLYIICDPTTVSFRATRYTVTFLFIIISVCIGFMYSRIMMIAWRQCHAIQVLVRQVGTGKNQQTKKNDFKAAKTGALVLGCYYLCWTPFFLLKFTQIFVEFYESKMSYYIRVSVAFLLIMSSASHPFIYAYRIPLLKAQFVKIFSRKRSA